MIREDGARLWRVNFEREVDREAEGMSGERERFSWITFVVATTPCKAPRRVVRANRATFMLFFSERQVVCPSYRKTATSLHPILIA